MPKLNLKTSGSKRPRIESNPSSPEISIYDRFFKITMSTGSFKNVSPFLLHKALQSIFGTLSDTKKLADGSLLIEVTNEKQSKIASSLCMLHNYEVITQPHKSLNIIKGVVTCSDLSNCSDDEILDNLKSQGVTELFRLPPRKGASGPSSTFILSFRLHQLPSKIHAGWYSLRVRPYFPSPMRCFQCQRFGHTASKCEQESLCPSCGHSQHLGSTCTSPPACVNCKGNHSPRYKGCPLYKQEFEIQKIRTLDKISYFDAKRKYLALNPSFSMSFSSVTKGIKPKMISTYTQCDLFNLNSQSSPQSSEDTFYPTPHPPSTSSPQLPLPIPSPIPPPSHPSLPPPKPPSTPKNLNISITPTNTKSSSSKPPTTQPKHSHQSQQQKKKLVRSTKSNTSSSSESILELSTSDSLMDLDPSAPPKNSSKKKA